MKNLIGICDTNIVYMKKLAEAFMQKADIPLQIMTFSNHSQLIQYLKDSRLDILIAGGDFSVDPMEKWQGVDAGKNIKLQEVISQHVGYLLKLKDEKGGVERDDDCCLKISRYQSATELYCLIRQLITGNQSDDKSMVEYRELKTDSWRFFNSKEVSETDGIYAVRKNFQQEKGYILAVYSPVNRCGKTSFAVLLSKFLQKKNNALMICMDHYSKVFSDEEFNLSELIYCMSRECNLRQKESGIHDFSEYGNYVKKWEDISYISAPRSVEDISQISAQQLCFLLKVLKNRSDFQYIVVDLSEGIENIYKVLEQCDFIFMPVLEDCISQCKIEEFSDHMANLMGPSAWKQLSDKIHKIQLPLTFEANGVENYYRELIWSDLAAAVGDIVNRYNI